MNPIIERNLPARYWIAFLRAAEEEIGSFSLRMIAQESGLTPDRINALMAPEPVLMTAVEFAALLAIFRRYYGTGARGSLVRIGRSAWRYLLAQATPGERLELSTARLMPGPVRRLRTLQALAYWLAYPDGRVTVQAMDTEILFTDQSSDTTQGQQASEPVCWVTIGLIQGAALWATGEEHDVTESACHAAGGDACTFRILI